MTARVLTVAELTGLVRAVFAAAGFGAVQAAALTEVIVAAERDGCKSHGIYRIEGCLRTLRAGMVDGAAEPALVEDAGAILRIDGRDGFANAALELGRPLLAERARALGMAALVINDATHFSALWADVETLGEAGLAALAFCPSYASVAPAGGTRPLLGTNPFAFAWPRRDGPPYVFDFATSVAARGEIELHRRAGTPLPPGWALDAEGRPTTDPEAALAGAMLPFGGHKGSALSTMIELMAGAMIGDLTSPEALARLGTTALAPRHGELVLAFCPARFAAGRPGDPLARGEALLEAIAGQGARLPSQRRHAARAEAVARGIALTEEEMAQLERLRRLGVEAVG